MFPWDSSRASGAYWGLDETRVWGLQPSPLHCTLTPALANLFPHLLDGIQIVAFALSAWIYSLGHPAYTKQQLNLRVSAYGAGDWDRELNRRKSLAGSLINSEVVHWWGDGHTDPHEAILNPNRGLPKWSFSLSRQFPNSTQPQLLPQASVLLRPASSQLPRNHQGGVFWNNVTYRLKFKTGCL